MNEGRACHQESIVFDACCPLASVDSWYESWIKGQATAIAPTVAANDGAAAALRNVAVWLEKIAGDHRLVLIEHPDQFYEVKGQGKLGVVFHFQNTLPFEGDLSLVKAFARLGVRIVQLAYNTRNLVGDGCDERTECGLSRFGVQLVKELNRAGIVVDLSHTGYRTTLEAIDLSERPVVFTHSNVRAICDSARNITDEQIKAVAQTGGVIGLNGFPGFLGAGPEPTIEDFLRHLRYVVELVGVDHVGLGIDYYEGMSGVATDEEARKIYDRFVRSGLWRPQTYPPPPWHYPLGMRRPEELPNLTAALVEQGFSGADIGKILGLNFVRVFREVWL